MPQQQTLKRAFAESAATTSQISDELDVITDQDIDLMDMDEIEKTKISEPDIAISLRAKSFFFIFNLIIKNRSLGSRWR
uniref:Uncharacterized protein n=1 Tax=Meloidogyne enterolobii TaxID=390850 RepID=A0A6V7UM79_MELEN|nr:unnamed protein product [Meloidogyne enterolobii]